MALNIYNDRISITIPNSEASIDAQHNGIKDRTVGQYYMSELYNEVRLFLNDLTGYFYVDLAQSFLSGKGMIEELNKIDYKNKFKGKLKPQESALNSIQWYLKNSDNLFRISPPQVNEKAKYLKFDGNSSIFTAFRTLCLGDLTQIIIRKITRDCFIISMKEIENFNDFLLSIRAEWNE